MDFPQLNLNKNKIVIPNSVLLYYFNELYKHIIIGRYIKLNIYLYHKIITQYALKEKYTLYKSITFKILLGIFISVFWNKDNEKFNF